jgi:hypothetical protein
VTTVVRGLSPTLLQRQKLIAEVNEGHVLAFPAKLESEDPSIERQRLVDIAHFEGDVVETDGTCPFGIRHAPSKAQASLPQSERRPVSNYRCFGTFPQAQKTQPAGDGGEPTFRNRLFGKRAGRVGLKYCLEFHPSRT